jgi:prepilin-type N-terminal cleavage/methylation domain-containing protein
LRREAFTLIELVAVLAIMAVMVGILAPAIAGLQTSHGLTASVNLVANFANMARENAMAKNAMIALVVVTDSSHGSANNSIVLMELNGKSDGSAATSADWKQTTKWQPLSSGVIFDPASLGFNKSTDSAQGDGVPSPALPELRCNAMPVASYSYLIFLPNGSLLRSNPSQLKLVNGIVSSSGAVTYTHPAAGGGAPGNYYNITFLSATGRIKINRL